MIVAKPLISIAAAQCAGVASGNSANGCGAGDDPRGLLAAKNEKMPFRVTCIICGHAAQRAGVAVGNGAGRGGAGDDPGGVLAARRTCTSGCWSSTPSAPRPRSCRRRRGWAKVVD